MGAEELKSSVAQLPAEELANFARWFEEFMADQWDQQIEADILAGRLDAAGRRTDEDDKAGRCTEGQPMPDLHETALLSEPALAKDWNRSEEDVAWSYLQPVR